MMVSQEEETCFANLAPLYFEGFHLFSLGIVVSLDPVEMACVSMRPKMKARRSAGFQIVSMCTMSPDPFQSSLNREQTSKERGCWADPECRKVIGKRGDRQKTNRYLSFCFCALAERGPSCAEKTTRKTKVAANRLSL